MKSAEPSQIYFIAGKNGDVFAFVVRIYIKFGPKHSPDGLHKTLLGLNRDFILIPPDSSLCFLLVGPYRFVSSCRVDTN